jgi:two-component system response regulator HydG
MRATSPTSAPPPCRVLVVDDDVEHARTLVRLLERAEYAAEAVHDVDDALAALRRTPFDLVLTDLVMPGKSGMDLLQAIRHLRIASDVVLMTAFGTVERAVEAMRAGASDFIVKPIKRATLLQSLDRVVEAARLKRENRALRDELRQLRAGQELQGISPMFRKAVATARQAAASDATVLLLGESGTGKELFAREIHAASHRSDGPFVPLHCAALPETLIESELFGHEAGAFTGAIKANPGRIEAANGGTLFLDEIGELPATVQVKLLRVLQEGEVQRVGATAPRPVDVRVVAATHRDLQAMVEAGSFREDLYYRLHVISVDIPALRDRPEDIELLAAHFIRAVAARERKTPPTLSADARRALRGWTWPGNVRELQNAMERAVVLCASSTITAADLPAAVDASSARPEVVVVPVGTSAAEAERRLLLATLAHADGDKGLAASILGIGRRTVYRKLEEYAKADPDLSFSSDD